MSHFTLQNKNITTFENLLAHSKSTILNEMKDYTFESVVFSDGTQLKDVTFAELVNLAWTLQSKNTTTYSNQTKS